MKKINLIFTILFLLSVKTNSQYFEGIITYKTTFTPPDPFTAMYNDTTWQYTVKDDKIRSEYSGDFVDSYNICSNTKYGDISITEIDTIQKIYTILLLEIEEDDEYNFDKTKGYIYKKRQNQQILGYNCKHYRYKNDSWSFDFWITDSIIPQVNGFGNFIKNKGVILKTIFKFPNSVRLQEAVYIEQKPISSELFKIPADCKPKNSTRLIKSMRKYNVDEKLIPKDSLSNVKDTAHKIDYGKWGGDN